MNETVTYIRDTLDCLYPVEEINSLVRRVVEHVCHMPLHQQLLRKDTQLSQTEKERIRAIVQRLVTAEPVQYVLGETTFCGLTFEVDSSVLIPRPETEELMEVVIRTLSDSRLNIRELKIWDVGTGSGCIAIALARYLPEAEVYASDISGRALETAKCNARRNGVAVRFVEADILRETPSSLPSFDVIVSNPPYICVSEKSGMHANVLDFEPHEALFVPDGDPLLFYRRIASAGVDKLTPGGWLFFEINEACGEIVVDMLCRKGYRDVKLIRDLSNKERMIKAIK